MLRSFNEIIRFQRQGIDEEIGRCKYFLFDTRSGRVSYMVADTNKWLPGGRKILISPYHSLLLTGKNINFRLI